MTEMSSAGGEGRSQDEMTMALYTMELIIALTVTATYYYRVAGLSRNTVKISLSSQVTGSDCSQLRTAGENRYLLFE